MNNDVLLFYADDDSDDLDFFADAAGALNLSYRLFQNGEQLLQALKSHADKTVIIFVDLNMPGKSGYEVIAEIKECEALSAFPTIVLSTAGDQMCVNESKFAGADYYIQKPTTMKVLKDAIASVIKIDWKLADSHTFFHRP